MLDEKIEKIEKIAKEIEGEKSFDTVMAKFTMAAELIKQALSIGEREKGRVLELVKELDLLIEKALA